MSKKFISICFAIPTQICLIPAPIFHAVFGARVLTSSQRKVLMVVIRHTYGEKKDAAEIPAEKISRFTKLQLTHVYKARKELIDANVLVLNGKLLSINPNLDDWTVSKAGGEQ